MKTKKRFKGIDAASMADVAFLLLIFFMIVTKINQDKGLLMKLPEIEESKQMPLNKRNVLQIFLNDESKLLVGNKEIQFDQLHEQMFLHLNNYGEDENKSDHPKKAIIIFEQSRGASYESYLGVHNEIKLVYKALREDLSAKWTNNQYHYTEILEKAKENIQFEILKDSIHNEIPMRVQEVFPDPVASSH